MENWEKIFSYFYDDNETGGSSRWKVSPDTVKSFIKGLIRDTQRSKNKAKIIKN